MRILFCLLLAASVQAGVLDDLESCRASVTRRCHISDAGIGGYTIAEVDSAINESRAYHSAMSDLYPTPFTKIDSIPLADGVDVYTLNSDYVAKGLKYCIKRHVSLGGKPVNKYVPVVAIRDIVTPSEGEEPNQVFEEGGFLGVHPIPSGTFIHDTLKIWYQALPAPMTLDTSSMLVIQKYREMIILYVCWGIKDALGEIVDAARFEQKYLVEKAVVSR